MPDAEEIKERIRILEERRNRYLELEDQRQNSGLTEISTTDIDVRLMAANNNGVDVAYNVQTAVDHTVCRPRGACEGYAVPIADFL